MDIDPLKFLPSSHEIGQKLLVSVRRTKHLRLLYNFLLKVEREHFRSTDDSYSEDGSNE